MREDADKFDIGDEEGSQSCIEGRIRRINVSLNFQGDASQEINMKSYENISSERKSVT